MGIVALISSERSSWAFDVSPSSIPIPPFPKIISHLPPLGVVRAGQWSRRLIINDGLEQGSQLPYIKRAIDRGYSILVMNTNLNKDLSSDKVCVKYFTNITKYSSGHGPNRSVSLKDWTGSKIVTMVLTGPQETPITVSFCWKYLPNLNHFQCKSKWAPNIV